MRNLGALGAGHVMSVGNAINESGAVVGFSRPDWYSERAFVWDETSGMRDLGSLLTGGSSEANDVNESNQVVGYTDIAIYNPERDLEQTTTHAFIWTEDAGMRLLTGTDGLQGSGAYAVNNLGQAAGWTLSPVGNAAPPSSSRARARSTSTR